LPKNPHGALLRARNLKILSRTGSTANLLFSIFNQNSLIRYIESADDVRVPFAYKNGGKTAENPKAVSKLRAVGKDFIYKVGKHILSGNFNLTTIPFPIRAMIPKSYLEYVGSTASKNSLLCGF